jgi:uncharacterized damage-inducible protein DinB
MNKVLINHYISQLNLAYYGDNWLDEHFKKKLALIDSHVAFTIPMPGIHSIAEVISHIVEWRKELLQRLQTGRAPALKMESPENWLSNEVLKSRGWPVLITTLEETHLNINDFLQQKDDSFFEQKWQHDETYGFLIAGWLEHDLYHLGQIGLIYKMLAVQGLLTK